MNIFLKLKNYYLNLRINKIARTYLRLKYLSKCGCDILPQEIEASMCEAEGRLSYLFLLKHKILLKQTEHFRV